VSAFTTYRQYDAGRQAAMREQLQRIAKTEGLSENVYEIVSKSLE
jgi:aminopeptidase N